MESPDLILSSLILIWLYFYYHKLNHYVWQPILLIFSSSLLCIISIWIIKKISDSIIYLNLLVCVYPSFLFSPLEKWWHKIYYLKKLCLFIGSSLCDVPWWGVNTWYKFATCITAQVEMDIKNQKIRKVPSWKVSVVVNEHVKLMIKWLIWYLKWKHHKQIVN